MSARHVAPLLSACSLFICACLEPPELGEAPSFAAAEDDEALDSWGPLDGLPGPLGESADTDGPGSDEQLESSGQDSAESESESETDDPGASENPQLEHLRLTEVHVDPAGKDGDLDSPEFVELQNTGQAPIIMSGLILEAQSWPQVTAELLDIEQEVLEPGAHLVVRRWSKEQSADFALPQRQGSTLLTAFLHNEGLRNSWGSIQIGSSLLGEIDEFVYGDAGSSEPSLWSGDPASAPDSGLSSCRIALDEHDADAWTGCPPSPGEGTGEAAPLVSVPPGSLVITEVWADTPGPSSDEKYSEYIELTNISDVEVELSGCTIGDALEPDAPGVDPLLYFDGEGGCASPTCLAPGRRALIIGNAYDGVHGDLLLLATDDSTIADGGLTTTETLILWDQEGVEVSSYRAWPDPNAEPLPSEELPLHRMDPLAEDEASAWQVGPASPGQ